MMVAIIIIGCGLSMLIGSIVWLLQQGNKRRRSSVHYWGYGPSGPYGGWDRDPMSVGERVDRSIEEGRRRAAHQRFSPHHKKKSR